MNRRTFSQTLGGLVASAVLPWTRTAAEAPPPATSADHVHMAVPTGPPQQIAMVIHPRCIPLDVFGPHAVLVGLGNVQVHLVWKTRDAVVAASGVPSSPPRPLRSVRAISPSCSCPAAWKGAQRS